MIKPMQKRYHDLNTYYRKLFGCRVHKIGVDAGMTCPNRDGTLSVGGCIYCNARGSGTGAFNRGIGIAEQLERSKKYIVRRFKAKKFIAYFQSFTNTYAPLSKLRQLYEEALSVPDIVGLSIGTRPDCVDKPVLALLESYAASHLVWLELGLQSVHDRTLATINRGHDYRCFEHAVRISKGRNIRIAAHVILGLPGETRRHMMQTADTLARVGIDGLKLHLLYVVKGTELERRYREEEFRCLSREEYADLVCEFLERTPGDVIIQRLTGDPHPQELVAPAWALQKDETLKSIHGLLEKRNTWQGKRTES